MICSGNADHASSLRGYFGRAGGTGLLFFRSIRAGIDVAVCELPLVVNDSPLLRLGESVIEVADFDVVGFGGGGGTP